MLKQHVLDGTTVRLAACVIAVLVHASLPLNTAAAKLQDSLRASSYYTPQASRPLSAYQQPAVEASLRSPTTMRYGRAQGRGFGKWGFRGPPPDLPSLMLDGRCIWIGATSLPA